VLLKEIEEGPLPVRVWNPQVRDFRAACEILSAIDISCR
jgi:poly(A) polymerase Pap1